MENNRKIMEKSPACSGNTRKGTVCRDISWEITVIFVLLLLFIGGTVSVFCDQKWQGNAAMIRKGAFDSPGMYAASNSFPINSKIQVRNLRNNRALQVIVVQRIPETMNVFLLLSEDSARQLGMGENDVINVEVSVISFGTGDVIGLPDDLPYNPDLDVYPYVTDVPGLTPYATMAPTPEAIPEATAAFMPEPTVTPEPGTTAAPTPAITPEVSPESTPFPGETAEPETASESVGREPQKNLFLPPHEDEAYTLDEVTRPDEEIDSDEIAYQPADADIDIKDEETGESSLESPVRTDEELEVATVDSPDVENPTVEDKKSAGKKEEALVVAEADLPRVPEKESSVPDPSTDVPEKRETDIAFVQEEPVPPEQSGKEPPDPTEEMPRAGEKEIALTEKEPDVPQKEKSVPDPTHETPTVDEEKDIALTEKEPDVPQKEKSVPDPTHETPTVDEEKDIALDTKEPPLHEDGEKTTTDAGKTYEEIVEITLEEADPHPPGTRDDREITEIVSDASHRIDETETALLVPGYYFIQLGAYAEKQLASSIQKRFTNLYPVKIYEIAHTKITIYKVLVGPLNKDESDTLLFRFKALGYRDAFVKYIN